MGCSLFFNSSSFPSLPPYFEPQIDHDIRTQAEKYLVDAEEKQYGQFLIALCTEFATEDRPLRNRQLAGIHIKNLIHSRDADAYNVKKLRWEQCPEDTKYQARAAFMQALNSPHVTVSHTSAQVLAAYGAVDIPAGRFPELLTSLCDNV